MASANLDAVRRRIADACRGCGRRVEEVVLVAVTKYVSAETARLLADLGVRDLGESRPQELWRKADVLGETVHWHLIGHWQTNKVRRTLPYLSLAHALDRSEIVAAAAAEATRIGRTLDACLEVKLTEEPTKHGYSPTELRAALEHARRLTGLRIVGLMGMAPAGSGPETARGCYRRLRELRDESATEFGDLPVLSMGMSDDFEVAIAEGATHIRVGSALWQGLTT